MSLSKRKKSMKDLKQDPSDASGLSVDLFTVLK